MTDPHSCPVPTLSPRSLPRLTPGVGESIPSRLSPLAQSSGKRAGRRAALSGLGRHCSERECPDRGPDRPCPVQQLGRFRTCRGRRWTRWTLLRWILDVGLWPLDGGAKKQGYLHSATKTRVIQAQFSRIPSLTPRISILWNAMCLEGLRALFRLLLGHRDVAMIVGLPRLQPGGANHDRRSQACGRE